MENEYRVSIVIFIENLCARQLSCRRLASTSKRGYLVEDLELAMYQKKEMIG